ncbi:hypothetical protein [Geodermatophilus sp. Leaf369]|uniref:hypothetical protein n=1 Tax=Geodermatophilus sp. Leaf369 TaxID=1736354 RepID=UPI0012FA7E5E|nr:hypothetical protein [Geodermatophilus sp. Leaf369]
MAEYVREITELHRSIRKLWESVAVGPPGLPTDAPLERVLDVVSKLRGLWWPEASNVTTGADRSAYVAKRVDEALTVAGEGDRTVILWREFLSLMRQELDPESLDIESFADDLITSAQELAKATANAWSGLGDVPNRERFFVDAQALLDTGRRIAEEEDLRRVAARVRVKETTLDAAVEAAQATLETQREAAGVSGSLGLATHFSELAKNESKRADLFLGAAIAVVVAFIVIVAFFVPHTDVAVTELISRAIIALPGFGLAAYLAREGGRHRHVAQWAKSLEVQLKTVDAFAAPMTTADVSEVRKAFASRAFGAVPAIPGRQSGSDSPAPVDLQAIIERLITELRVKG